MCITVDSRFVFPVLVEASPSAVFTHWTHKICANISFVKMFFRLTCSHNFIGQSFYQSLHSATGVLVAAAASSSDLDSKNRSSNCPTVILEYGPTLGSGIPPFCCLLLRIG